MYLSMFSESMSVLRRWNHYKSYSWWCITTNVYQTTIYFLLWHLPFEAIFYDFLTKWLLSLLFLYSLKIISMPGMQLWLKITLLRNQRFFGTMMLIFTRWCYKSTSYDQIFFFYWKKLLWYFNSFQFVGAKEFSLIFNSTGSWGHNFVNLLMWCYESILYMCFNFFFFRGCKFLGSSPNPQKLSDPKFLWFHVLYL